MANAPNAMWLDLVQNDIQSTVTRFDDEMIYLVGLAAYIGDASGDQTPVSYSSLMISLLWSEDPTSIWFQNFADSNKVAIQTIYRHRGIKADDKARIIKNMESGGDFNSMGKDFVSVSARAMLQTAELIADEVKDAMQIGVRHLLAAYAFLNRPDHESDLKNWNIDEETLRSELSPFIIAQYQDEEQGWSSRLRSYVESLREDVGGDYDPGIILANYTFEQEAIDLLRLVEALAMYHSGPVLNTQYLLNITLFSLLSDNYLFDKFRESISLQGIDLSFLERELGGVEKDLLPTTEEFISGSSLGISSGLKKTLDRARTYTFTTNPNGGIGVRHIISALLVQPDTFAAEKLKEANASFPKLRRELLHSITRNWLNDDGVEWNKILIGVTPPTLTPYKSDNPDEGYDCLDVSRYASAFATVMAAHSNKPPMSIGIFGDWGSGKSFFMRLMREKTNKITKQTDTDENSQRVFCENVVAIEFNAWHYAETNLWASLVHTILTKLNEAIHEDSNSVEKLEQLELARFAKQEAERIKKEFTDKEELAYIHCEAVKSRFLKKQKEHKELLSTKDVLSAVAHEALADHDVDEMLSIAEDRLGIKGAKTMERNIGEINRVIKSAHAQYSEIESTWEWIKKPHIYKALGSTALLVAMVAALSIYLYSQSIEPVKWIDAIFTEVTAIVGAVLLHSMPLINGIKQAMSRLGSMRSRLDAIVQARQQQRSMALAEAARELMNVENELSRANERLELAHNEVLRIEDEIAGRSSINQIAGMIERRLAGREYEQYLSIISMIRRDFGELSKYFANGNNDDFGLRKIERIVLYIDDLDRCPSDQVVKVLEAVHLMLAFKLFVVVVGVDMRWASISLHQHYPAHLSSLDTNDIDKDISDDKSSRQLSQSASAMDYLEKIFQIPFWLPPMEEKASRDMLAALVPVTSASQGEGQEEDDRGEVQQQDSRQDDSGGDISAANTNAEEKQGGKQENTEIAAAESLEIVEEERKYMLSLAAAIGRSPRRLKRFVNTYRILKASCDPLEREDFVKDSGKSGTYRAVMTLLAITTGAPRAAMQILLALNTHDATYELPDLINDVNEMSIKYANGEIDYVLEALKVYADNVESKPANISELKTWVSRAAHFSFRSGRI